MAQHTFSGNASDPDWGRSPDAPPPPSEHVLSVTVESIGARNAGVVWSRPSGIRCGRDCSETYPAGTVVTLKAHARGRSVFRRLVGRVQRPVADLRRDDERVADGQGDVPQQTLGPARSAKGGDQSRSASAVIYTPKHLAEEIPRSRAALQGERKQLRAERATQRAASRYR